MTDEDYRTNAVPPIDKTEIAKERIRQEAETKRKRIEEKEQTKRHAMGEGGAFSYTIARVIAAVVIVAGICGGSCVAEKYFEAKKAQHAQPDGACRDELLMSKDNTPSTLRCSHPMHVANPHTSDRLFCKCIFPSAAPSASSAP